MSSHITNNPTGSNQQTPTS